MDNNEARKEWLARLRVGDRVIVRAGDSFFGEKIYGITDAALWVGDVRFSADTVESAPVAGASVKLIESSVDELERNRMLDSIRCDIDSLATDKLKAIRDIING